MATYSDICTGIQVTKVGDKYLSTRGFHVPRVGVNSRTVNQSGEVVLLQKTFTPLLWKVF